jgi:hypothetical protein
MILLASNDAFSDLEIKNDLSFRKWARLYNDDEK